MNWFPGRTSTPEGEELARLAATEHSGSRLDREADYEEQVSRLEKERWARRLRGLWTRLRGRSGAP